MTAARAVTRALRRPFDDVGEALAALSAVPPLPALVALAAGVVGGWLVYVPVHELLHVAGCVATGGSVSELQIQAWYGGPILARVFPFVTVGGDYAGRLSGFDTGGSDLVYLATDFAPYLLSIAVGVPLLERCAGRPRPLLTGAAVVVALAPLYNVPGDYYEMGSILATRAAGLFGEPAFAALRSDDLAALIAALAATPESLGVAPGARGPAVGIVVLGVAAAVVLAFLSYAAGTAWAALLRRIAGR